MKKAKVMLAAIAIFAVAGSALAFKAKATHFLFFPDAAIPTSCDVRSISFTTLTHGVVGLPVYSTQQPYATVKSTCNAATTVYTITD